jgi:glutathione S-transferase
VISVLELGLERNGSGWLVGDKCTFADLSFVTWNLVGESLLAELGRLHGLQGKYLQYAAWMKRLGDRKDVQSIKARMAQGRAEHGLK